MIEKKLKNFVLAEFAEQIEQKSIDVNDDLLSMGIVDSMGVLQIVNFIEEHFGIKVEDEEITIDNFRTISAVARFVSDSQSSENLKK